MPVFYSRYGKLPPSPVKKLDTETKLVSQSEADMVSLKAQLQRFGIDGLAARLQATQDKFGYADTRLVPDFATLQNRVVDGINYFRELPSEVRAEFNHKPEKFYDYISNNPDKALERGFITSEKQQDLKFTNLNNEPKKVDEVVNVADKVEPAPKLENEEK